MKKINKSSLLAAAITVLAIVFLIDSQAVAQVSSNAVSISFKKPPVPSGAPDPFKKWWFQHSFEIGEYHVDVSIPFSDSILSDTRGSVFLSGKGATAVVFPGNTAEICGDMVFSNKYFCLPLKEGNVITKLDIFAKVKAVKAKKIRPTNYVTIWEIRNFTGKNMDLGVGTHDLRNLDFDYIKALWIPAGYWAKFCTELSADRQRCGSRDAKNKVYRSDDNSFQPSRGDPHKINYVLVGKGNPPPEPILKSFPKPDTKPLAIPNPLPKSKSKRLP